MLKGYINIGQRCAHNYRRISCLLLKPTTIAYQRKYIKPSFCVIFILASGSTHRRSANTLGAGDIRPPSTARIKKCEATVSSFHFILKEPESLFYF